ncbi:MAG: hypothetical protein WAW80_01670 [Candidatus Saccharimonadales bacterium]
MYQQIINYLTKWHKNTDERIKLQHVYAFGGVILVFIAGLVGLFNYNLGQILLPIGLVAIAIFFINAIVWALLTAFVLLRLDERKEVKLNTKKR